MVHAHGVRRRTRPDVAATIAHLGQDSLPWIAAALVLYAITFVITIAVTSRSMTRSRPRATPTIRDLHAVRAAFDEGRWAAWNLVRTVASSTAFGLLAWALFVYGRASA